MSKSMVDSSSGGHVTLNHSGKSQDKGSHGTCSCDNSRTSTNVCLIYLGTKYYRCLKSSKNELECTTRKLFIHLIQCKRWTISMVTNQNRLSAYSDFVFLNRKVRHFANAYRILKCLKRIIQLLFRPHYMHKAGFDW